MRSGWSDDETRDISPREREQVLGFRNLQPGELFAGRYRILAAVGHGGAGEVLRARDEIAGQEVALKILFPGGGGTTLERLRRELRLVRELHHPGILRIHDIGEEGGLLYLVSDFLDGETLEERLKGGGGLDSRAVVAILGGLLEALAAAHEAGVVHRDVKPANVFLVPGKGAGERVVLVDFGLAREVESTALTTVGRFVGTPEYAAPEQIRGDVSVGPAADIYSAGTTAWKMIAGKPPFSGSSEVAVTTAHLDEQPPSPRRELAAATPALRELVVRMLEKDSRRRPTARDALIRLTRRGVRVNLSARLSMALRMGRVWRLRWALGVATFAGLLLANGWGLAPVNVRIDGSGLRVVTRSGIGIHRDSPGRRMACAALSARGVGPLRRLWVATYPPSSSRPVAGEDPGLWLARSVLLPFEPFSTIPLRYGGMCRFPHVEGGALRPGVLLPLDAHGRGTEPALALSLTHSPSYPSSLVLFSESGEQLGGYLHPGHIGVIRSFRHPVTNELYLALSAFNNLAGPRQVLIGLPASVVTSGQGPPFAAPVARLAPAPGWYTFFPFRSVGRKADLRVEGGVVRVGLQGSGEIRLDASNGVPIRAEQRGGLSAEEWARRRGELFEKLYEAEGMAQSGRPAEGAALLDAFAEGIDAPAEMVSIARYRAADMWMRAAPAAGEGAWRAALESVDSALAAEPSPPRYRLLRTELLLRLDRRRELRDVLAAWGSREEGMMYAYEHMLLDLLAGSPVKLRRFVEAWPADSVSGLWSPLTRMVLAYQEQDWSELDRQYARVPRNWRAPWDLHSYWMARSLLDRPEANPRRALELLTPEALAPDTGMDVPAACARLLARVLLDGAAPEKMVHDGETELARFERDAAGDLHTLFMLRFARRDMARARKAMRRAVPSAGNDVSRAVDALGHLRGMAAVDDIATALDRRVESLADFKFRVAAAGDGDLRLAGPQREEFHVSRAHDAHLEPVDLPRGSDVSGALHGDLEGGRGEPIDGDVAAAGDGDGAQVWSRHLDSHTEAARVGAPAADHQRLAPYVGRDQVEEIVVGLDDDDPLVTLADLHVGRPAQVDSPERIDLAGLRCLDARSPHASQTTVDADTTTREGESQKKEGEGDGFPEQGGVSWRGRRPGLPVALGAARIRDETVERSGTGITTTLSRSGAIACTPRGDGRSPGGHQWRAEGRQRGGRRAGVRGPGGEAENGAAPNG